MFGFLKPDFNLLDTAEKAAYQKIYCNLCGCLGELYGAKSRMLLVNDVVTLGWLFRDESPDQQRYIRANCVRGGTFLPQTSELSRFDRLMASISGLICQVKIDDNLADNPGLSSRFAQWFYTDTAVQCREELQKIGFQLDVIESSLQRQAELERQNENDLLVAAEPTGTCYGQFCQSLVENQPSCIYPHLAHRIGHLIGKLVYLLDAWRDRRTDTVRDYNPFLCAQGIRFNIPQRNQINQFQTLFNEIIAELDHLADNTGPLIARKWLALRNTLVHQVDRSRGTVTVNFCCGEPRSECGNCFHDCSMCQGLCCLGCVCMCLNR
jgi:hypothetical protein